MFDSVEER